MMKAQGSGRPINGAQLDKMIRLLRETDLSLGEVAERFQCSRSAVQSVNRRFSVRFYNGARARWALNN